MKQSMLTFGDIHDFLDFFIFTYTILMWALNCFPPTFYWFLANELQYPGENMVLRMTTI